mmetsp:Transcript_1106/g.1691  ORF Transcript_1106/g.1691 Transcript_1106/m.1691 type:complete len:115 (+) Transcript_1106:36-380(+)
MSAAARCMQSVRRAVTLSKRSVSSGVSSPTKVTKGAASAHDEHDHHDHDHEPPRLFGEKPNREREDWELPYYFFMGTAAVTLFIGLNFRPNTDIDELAKEEAIRRGLAQPSASS